MKPSWLRETLMKPWQVSAPRWMLLLAITILIFLCGDFSRQVKDLQGRNEIYRDQMEQMRIRMIEDNTKEDVAVLKKTVFDHSIMLDRYWTALDKNSAAINGLTHQVERLVEITKRRR